ncbi:hypothetical protein ACS0YX_32780 [Burkholderia gladioli]|uniref:hypothetical protein n=1 Tax=Burkholderia gladioli TaxID=28095 RepID=UPI003F79DCFC
MRQGQTGVDAWPRKQARRRFGDRIAFVVSAPVQRAKRSKRSKRRRAVGEGIARSGAILAADPAAFRGACAAHDRARWPISTRLGTNPFRLRGASPRIEFDSRAGVGEA